MLQHDRCCCKDLWPRVLRMLTQQNKEKDPIPVWHVLVSELPSSPGTVPIGTAEAHQGWPAVPIQKKNLWNMVCVLPNQGVLRAAYRFVISSWLWDFISDTIICYTSSFRVSCCHFRLAFLSAGCSWVFMWVFLFPRGNRNGVTFYVTKNLHQHIKRKETSALVHITHTHTSKNTCRHMEWTRKFSAYFCFHIQST